MHVSHAKGQDACAQDCLGSKQAAFPAGPSNSAPEGAKAPKPSVPQPTASAANANKPENVTKPQKQSVTGNAGQVSILIASKGCSCIMLSLQVHLDPFRKDP